MAQIRGCGITLHVGGLRFRRLIKLVWLRLWSNYLATLTHVQSEDWFGTAKICLKVKLFAWQLCHNSLATCSNLIYRKICTFGRCLRCFAEVEDDHHLFLHCSYAMEGWLKIDFFPYQLLPKATSWLHLFRLISDDGPKESNNLDRFVMGLWGLWIARNRLVFFEEWNGGKRCNGGTTFPHILHRCTKPSWEGSKVQARSPILLVTSGDGIKPLTSLKLGELLTNSTTH